MSEKIHKKNQNQNKKYSEKNDLGDYQNQNYQNFPPNFQHQFPSNNSNYTQKVQSNLNNDSDFQMYYEDAQKTSTDPQIQTNVDYYQNSSTKENNSGDYDDTTKPLCGQSSRYQPQNSNQNYKMSDNYPQKQSDTNQQNGQFSQQQPQQPQQQQYQPYFNGQNQNPQQQQLIPNWPIQNNSNNINNNQEISMNSNSNIMYNKSQPLIQNQNNNSGHINTNNTNNNNNGSNFFILDSSFNNNNNNNNNNSINNTNGNQRLTSFNQFPGLNGQYSNNNGFDENYNMINGDNLQGNFILQDDFLNQIGDKNQDVKIENQFDEPYSNNAVKSFSPNYLHNEQYNLNNNNHDDINYQQQFTFQNPQNQFIYDQSQQMNNNNNNNNNAAFLYNQQQQNQQQQLLLKNQLNQQNINNQMPQSSSQSFSDDSQQTNSSNPKNQKYKNQSINKSSTTSHNLNNNKSSKSKYKQEYVSNPEDEDDDSNSENQINQQSQLHGKKIKKEKEKSYHKEYQKIDHNRQTCPSEYCKQYREKGVNTQSDKCPYYQQKLRHQKQLNSQRQRDDEKSYMAKFVIYTKALIQKLRNQGLEDEHKEEIQELESIQEEIVKRKKYQDSIKRERNNYIKIFGPKIIQLFAIFLIVFTIYSGVTLVGVFQENEYPYRLENRSLTERQDFYLNRYFQDYYFCHCYRSGCNERDYLIEYQISSNQNKEGNFQSNQYDLDITRKQYLQEKKKTDFDKHLNEKWYKQQWELNNKFKNMTFDEHIHTFNSCALIKIQQLKHINSKIFKMKNLLKQTKDYRRQTE